MLVCFHIFYNSSKLFLEHLSERFLFSVAAQPVNVPLLSLLYRVYTLVVFLSLCVRVILDVI